jgi:hypothetical protein
MNYPTAVKIAIQSMQKEMKQFSFDANLYRKLGIRTPTSENAYLRYCELEQAILMLKGQPKLNL